MTENHAVVEPVTPTEPVVNPAQEPENPAPPTTTAKSMDTGKKLLTLRSSRPVSFAGVVKTRSRAMLKRPAVNQAPPTTTASEGALVRSVVAPHKDLQRLVNVRHDSATANWHEAACLPPDVCQQMLKVMPSSSPRDITDVARYRYSLNRSQVAITLNQLTAMGLIPREPWHFS